MYYCPLNEFQLFISTPIMWYYFCFLNGCDKIDALNKKKIKKKKAGGEKWSFSDVFRRKVWKTGGLYAEEVSGFLCKGRAVDTDEAAAKHGLKP